MSIVGTKMAEKKDIIIESNKNGNSLAVHNCQVQRFIALSRGTSELGRIPLMRSRAVSFCAETAHETHLESV